MLTDVKAFLKAAFVNYNEAKAHYRAWSLRKLLSDKEKEVKETKKRKKKK